MANPDDTTILGDEFVETRTPVSPSPPLAPPRGQSDAPDRLVFFFSGFDPKSATFYHRLFRSGIAQRNAAHDETLALGKRHRIGRWASVWTTLWRGASSLLGGRPVTMRTRVHFMRWEDIVQRHWRRAPLTLARDYWNIYVGGLASGVLRRIWQAAPAAFWLAMFPLAVCALSIGAGLLLATTLLAATGLTSIGTAAASGLVVGALAWRLVARRVDGEWMLRLCAFMRQHAVGELPALDARLDEMAARLIEAVEARMRQPAAAPLREVMVMGYSSGSILAVGVLARALPRLTEVLAGRRGSKATSLSMVTLGQCTPVAAEWPAARAFRAALDLLAESSLLTWHDYSSVSDAAAFAQTPPWPQPARLRGFQGSPAFKAPRNLIKGMASRRGREAHLQYLQSPREGDSAAYDFFTVVCGPDTLEERHAQSRAAADLRAKAVT